MRQPSAQLGDNSAGDAGQSAGTRHEQDVGFAGMVMQSLEGGNEFASIGQINVVAARVDAGARNAIVLTLIGAGGMNDGKWIDRPELRLEVG